MFIQYKVKVTIVNLLNNGTTTFHKVFQHNLDVENYLLYDNIHIISNDVYILNLFSDEILAYCQAENIDSSTVEIDEYEVESMTDRIDIYFETNGDPDVFSLHPALKCYVYPKEDELSSPNLKGEAFDSSTIIWSWEDNHAHYLIEEPIDFTSEEEKTKIIAQLPIGKNTYVESGLAPDTIYTRRLVSYTDTQTSKPSAPQSVRTKCTDIDTSVEQYKVSPLYDFTSNNEEREIVEEKLEAFQSGVGSDKDLQVSKQMDNDFYEKFKAYLEVSGKRVEREKRYEQVGFNYKVCLEAKETIEEQEGEITFDLTAYPNEPVAVNQYLWAPQDVALKVKLEADVDLHFNSEIQETTTTDTKYYYPAEDGIDFCFVLDLSSSMLLKPGKNTPNNGSIEGITWETMGNSRAKYILDALKKISKYVLTELTYPTHDHPEGIPCKKNRVSLVCYATKAKKCSFDGHAWTNDYNKFNEVIDSIKITGNQDWGNTKYDAQVGGVGGLGNCTNWYKGLEYAYSRCKNARQTSRKVIIMLSDGGANVTSNGTFDPLNSSKVKNELVTLGKSIKNDSVVDDVWSVVTWQEDETLKDGKYEYTNSYLTGISDAIISGQGSRLCANKYFNSDNIIDMYKKVVEKSMEGYTKNFQNTVITSTGPVAATVHIVSDEYPFIITKEMTPVVYSKEEKRAVIQSPMLEQNVTEVSIYDMVMEKVKQTQEWKDGMLASTINGEDTSSVKAGIVIRNVSIFDTYGYSDATNIDTVNFTNWEGGMTGTVNVYTDLSKLDTPTYSDDVYLAKKTSKIKISGYSDAMIYEANRRIEAELNAWNRPSQTLISANGDYTNLLKCRKNPIFGYTGSNASINSVMTITAKGKDVFFTGQDIKEIGDEIITTGATQDITANINICYPSPILNYRFNIEDPDVKTPYYEILPTCDKESNYYHTVIVNVYYARNINIGQYDYIKEYGTDPNATKATPCKSFMFQNKIIDEYVWFYTNKMTKTIPYYDELPKKGMDSFYGLVNGRYRTDNVNGKQDLRVEIPEFNIPTTVTENNSDSIRIYIVITEFYPNNALISYKWDNPYNNQNGITKVNGDFVTFFSDNVTYKDIEYIDNIATYNMENNEIFDTKTKTFYFTIPYPKTIRNYTNYYLKAYSDNSDVIALHYPSEIFFDNGNAVVGVDFKGVVNATSKWSPRIHSGYYYINQHEYYAYSEFNVEANFDTIETENYAKAIGYLNVDVTLLRPAKPAESYSIQKTTRSELLQDESQFIWEDDKGVTLKPSIEGVEYKEYVTSTYYSPIILFDNVLTQAGPLVINYQFTEGFRQLLFDIRSYDVEEGKWSDWTPFTNSTSPNTLSCAYQIRCDLSATVSNTEYVKEDYLCCYLDWKDDMDEVNSTNVVTVTDHITTGPYNSRGTFISKIIEFGCGSGLMLELFGSSSEVFGFIAYSNTQEELLLENIKWLPLSSSKLTDNYKYYRYKIEIPVGQKLYWLHKTWRTLRTIAILPYIKDITMTGTFVPQNTTLNFINTESFEVIQDGESHVIFDKLGGIIEADILQRGFTVNEINKIDVTCTSANINISFDPVINAINPSPSVLSLPINASANKEYVSLITNTPYIFLDEDGKIEIIGTPQQFAPITLEDENGTSYLQLFDTLNFTQTEQFMLNNEKFITLKTNQYDIPTLNVLLNGKEFTDYTLINHLVVFKEFVTGEIEISYKICNSFIATIDRNNNLTTIYPYVNSETELPKKMKVYFETNTTSNRFVANHLSMNPIYRTRYDGFIYLTDEHFDAYSIRIYCNPRRVKAGGFDKVDISIEVLDINDNPIVGKEIAIDCKYGILNCSNTVTDINGIVHIVYESSYTPSIDIVTVTVIKDTMEILMNSITIENE